MRRLLTESPHHETYYLITHYSVRDRFPRGRANSVGRAEGPRRFESRDDYHNHHRYQSGHDYQHQHLCHAERCRDDEADDGNGEAER